MGEAALSHHTLSKLCRHRTHSQIWPPHFCTAACAAPCAAPLPNRTLDSILRCCSLQHSTCAKLRSTLRAPCSLWTESWTTRCKAPHSTLHSVWPNFATAPWKDSTLPSASASLPNSAHNLGAPPCTEPFLSVNFGHRTLDSTPHSPAPPFDSTFDSTLHSTL